jgi:pyruvate dehydrogenase E2 component (dihydrolipoamide acetyltransferase)
MKHLLNGVAIAAVLAIAAPAWAQQAQAPEPAQEPAPAPAAAPMAPGTAPGTPAPAAPAAKAAPHKATAHQMHHRRPVRHVARGHVTRGHVARRGRMTATSNAGDQMTEQLNREELSRIQSGGTAAPPAQPPMQGPPAPGQQ